MNYENKIIDFLVDTGLKLGLVTRQNDSRLQITDASGRSERATEKQVLTAHASVSESPEKAISALEQRITGVRCDIDTTLLWETVRDDGTGPMETAAFCNLYLGEVTPLGVSAVARCLLADTVHFKRKGLFFAPRSADEVAQLERQEQRRVEKACFQALAQTWMNDVLNERTREIPGEMQDFVRALEDFMFRGHLNEASRMLKLWRPQQEERRTGFDLLERIQRLPADADPHLLLHGITAEFPEAVERQAAESAPWTPDGLRSDFTLLKAFTIDDDDTVEVDDAITVGVSDESVTVGIHIADPSVFISKNDPVDQAARDRALTLYLPTTAVPMLPRRLGGDLASLVQDELRPSVSVIAVFSHAGELLDRRLERGQIRVRRRLSYDVADCMLDSQDGELAAQLQLLKRLADRLRNERLQNGAIVLVRPELKIHVHDGQIDIKPLVPNSPSRHIVGELMILANRTAAEFALAHDIPIIYRSQPAPAQNLKSMDSYDPVVFDQTVRQLKKSNLSTHPQRHAALGLELYTQISSPIRRYADLVIQRQIAAFLEGQPLPYQTLEMIEVLAAADSVESANRRLEREINRYWILQYLARHCRQTTLEATVVEPSGRAPLAELHGYYVRGLYEAKGTKSTGATVQVQIASVDPDKDRLILREVV